MSGGLPFLLRLHKLHWRAITLINTWAKTFSAASPIWLLFTLTVAVVVAVVVVVVVDAVVVAVVVVVAAVDNDDVAVSCTQLQRLSLSRSMLPLFLQSTIRIFIAILNVIFSPYV